jgi:hypothetical protein
VAAVLILLFAAPLVEAAWYFSAAKRGVFPPEADSISIPIFQFTAGLVLVSPFFLLVLWASTRRYPGQEPLLTWAPRAPVQSWAWSLFFGAAAALMVMDVLICVRGLDPIGAVHRTSCAYMALVLRASAVGRLRASGLLRNSLARADAGGGATQVDGERRAPGPLAQPPTLPAPPAPPRGQRGVE